MKNSNWQKIIHDTYIELYNNAEPKADFDELVANATINEREEKVIPFNDYRIYPGVMDSIVDYFEKKYKMNKFYRSQYEFAIYLGCSPVSDPTCNKRLNDEIPSDLR